MKNGDRKAGYWPAVGAIALFVLLVLIWPVGLDEQIAAFSQAIAAVAIIVTAIVGYRTYQEAANTTKNRTTYEQISRQVSDKDVLTFIDASRKIRSKYKDDDRGVRYDIVKAHHDRHEEAADELRFDRANGARTDYENILSLLNYYESWAVGVENKALSADMLKQWWRSTYVEDFIDYKPFIIRYRHVLDTKNAFVKYERLAHEWAETDIEKRKTTISDDDIENYKNEPKS